MIALLILSYTGGINKELQKPTKHFGHVFIGASVWAMGFAVMMLMDNTLYAHIARAVGVAGMHCAMVFMLLYAQSICRKQFEPTKAIFLWVSRKSACILNLLLIDSSSAS